MPRQTISWGCTQIAPAPKIHSNHFPQSDELAYCDPLLQQVSKTSPLIEISKQEGLASSHLETRICMRCVNRRCGKYKFNYLHD